MSPPNILSWKPNLLQLARYVAIADFVYAILASIFIIFELIIMKTNGLTSINHVNVPLNKTSMSEVLTTYLILGLINMILAVILYRGITTDNLKKCRIFLIFSILSTICGISTLIYHGCHLSGLRVSLFNSEFFISLAYHIYKIFALVLIAFFVRALGKLLAGDDETNGALRRQRYQSLDSTNGESVTGELDKHVFFGIPFSGRHVVTEDKFKIDYDTCIEYDETTSTLKGVLVQGSSSNIRDVAIKTLKSNFRTEKNMVELIKEAKLLFHVGNHEHILKLLAIYCTPDEDPSKRGNVMLIMEDYSARRLNDFLRTCFDNKLQNFQDLLGNDKGRPDKRSRRLGTVYENIDAINLHHQLETFSTMHMIQWAYQLSSAMDYLHNKNIVFGNLQAKSILLEKVSKIKLSNFGLASELHEGNNTITSIYLPGKISWRWTAVECLISTNQGLPTEFNEKTDVWSFGSTLWEIFSMGQTPNVSYNLSDYITDLVKGKRPEKPDFASEGIYKLMKTCWNNNPADRPSFNVSSLFFRQLLSASIQNDI